MEKLKNELIEKVAVFQDKNKQKQIVRINMIPNQFIYLKSYNEELKETGYASIYFHPNNRIFLDTIYCYDEYRGSNIATKLSRLIDYLLQNYEGFIIRGVYEPSQLSTDREKDIHCDKKELDERATNFYYKNGYKKITYEDYINNKELYSYINEQDDFQLGEEISGCIIAKKIQSTKVVGFKDIDGVIVDDSILDFECVNQLIKK